MKWYNNFFATLKNFDASEIELIRRRRQALILKELKEALTRAEEKEIQHLDWQLDRYEIAKDLDRDVQLVNKSPTQQNQPSCATVKNTWILLRNRLSGGKQLLNSCSTV